MDLLSLIAAIGSIAGTITVVTTLIKSGIIAPTKKLAAKNKEKRKAFIQEEFDRQFDEKLIPKLEDIHKDIQILAVSSKDVLRYQIMEIYKEGRPTHSLSLSRKEELDQYYKDYKQEGGNSFIDGYYNRMQDWRIYDPEYEGEEER